MQGPLHGPRRERAAAARTRATNTNSGGASSQQLWQTSPDTLNKCSGEHTPIAHR